MAVEFITIVWRLSPYRAEKLLVHLAFADWANLDGEFHPTYREIAEKARITRPGAIGIVQSMIEDKEIEMVEQARAGGRGNRNRYRFAEKYLDAVRELSRRWSARRAERVKQDDSFPQKRVNEDNPLRVKQDDPFSAEKVNEDAKKGKRGRAHIRNNRHEPSCNTTVMQQQQSAGHLPAAAPDLREDHKSVFSRFTVEDYVLATKHHATNPGGLARKLWRTGEEDGAIGQWMLAKDERRKREDQRASEPEIAADFDMDAWIDDLIANNWIPQLENEREGIEERGGPRLDWEHKVIAYFNKPAAEDAA